MLNGTGSSFHPLQESLDWADLLRVALANGGEWADAFWEKNATTSIRSQAQKLTQLSSGIDEGLGLRVLAEGCVHYAYTSDLSAEALYALARTLARQIHVSARGECAPLLIQSRDLDFRVQDPLGPKPLAQKIALLRRIESACEGVAEVQQAQVMVHEGHRQIFVARSDGRVVWDQQQRIIMACTALGQSEMAGSQQGYASAGGYWGLEDLGVDGPERVAQEAARQLKVLLRSVPAPSGTLPVVMAAQAGGTMCHEAVGHGLEGDYAARKLSAYSGRLGEQVAASTVTVIDDGTLARHQGSQAFDDEGESTQRTVLIENGVLKNFMRDRRSALRDGLISTGNGRRQSFRHTPMVRMTNTYIAPGTRNAQDILRETPHGLFVAQMGGGQVDTMSGNFVFNVREAYLIRNGELAEPVQGATLVGNGPQVLREVDAVGNDLGWANGTCGKSGQSVPVTDAQPTLRVPALTVGGRVALEHYFPSRGGN